MPTQSTVIKQRIWELAYRKGGILIRMDFFGPHTDNPQQDLSSARELGEKYCKANDLKLIFISEKVKDLEELLKIKSELSKNE